MIGRADSARYVPGGLNLAFALLASAVTLLALFAVPLAMGPDHVLATAPILAFVLASMVHWALVHEAVHSHFHGNHRVNEAAGRILAILFLASFDGLRFGHLSHHALNARASERP